MEKYTCKYFQGRHVCKQQRCGLLKYTIYQQGAEHEYSVVRKWNYVGFEKPQKMRKQPPLRVIYMIKVQGRETLSLIEVYTQYHPLQG